MPTDERIKARIKGILREAKEDEADAAAGVILAIVKQSQKGTWLMPVLVGLLAAITTAALTLLIYARLS